MNVGIITHLSNTYPLLVADMQSSLKLSLNDTHEVVKTSYVRAEADVKEITEEAQRLLIEEVDVLVVYSGVEKLEAIQDLVSKMGKKAVLVNAGAKPRTNDSAYPNIYWVSLQLMEAAYELSRFLSKENKETLCALSDFINSGYQMVASFVNALEQNKGEILFQHSLPQEGDMDQLVDQLASKICEESPSVVYFNAQEAEGKKLATLINKEEIRKQCPETKWGLSGQLTHELEPTFFAKNSNVFSCHSWKQGEARWSAFEQQFEAKVKRIPNPLTVLMYEAGLLINKWEEGIATKIESPRGTLTLQEEKMTFLAPLNIHKLDEKGQFSAIGEEIVESKSKGLEGAYGGWKNAYLCY